MADDTQKHQVRLGEWKKDKALKWPRQVLAKYLLVALEIYHLPTQRQCGPLRIQPPLAKYVSSVLSLCKHKVVSIIIYIFIFFSQIRFSK